MAAVAAQLGFRVLGEEELGMAADYHRAKMLPANVGQLHGELEWRQRDGGRADAPNWKYFIPWADKHLNHSGMPGCQ